MHYLRTMLLAIEWVRSGVATVQDDLINRLGELELFDGAAEAYRDLGLRAAITTSMGVSAGLVGRRPGPHGLAGDVVEDEAARRSQNPDDGYAACYLGGEVILAACG